MSLNFDLREIPEDVRTIVAVEDDPQRGVKKGDRLMSPVTNLLIWSTMAVGIGVINDETAVEFHARLDLLAKLDLCRLEIAEYDEETGGWVNRRLTLEEVEAHKGLSTNVFPMESRASFVKRWITTSNDVFPNPEPKRKR